MKSKKVSEYLKYEFSFPENSENAQTLARKTRALAEHEAKKKQLVADLKAEEEALKSDIAKVARFVTDGYDFRMIECDVIFDSPGPGFKTVSRTDTGEVVKEIRMSPEELQQKLQFAEKAE